MPPVRRPFPFDLVLDNVGLMLGRGKKGADLVGTKPNDMSNVAPADYDYSALPPAFGRIQTYHAFTQGYGLPVQEKFSDPACHYCLNADTSAGAWIKGPAINAVVLPWGPIPPEPVTHVFDVNGKLYALAGRCVFKCDLPNPPSWSLAKDFGEGRAGVDVVVFHTNAGGGQEYAYIAMGDTDAAWRLDGTNPWEQRVQVLTVTIANSPTGGHYHFHYGATPTVEIAFDAGPATVEAALRAIPELAEVTVQTSGAAPNYTHTVTFIGRGNSATSLTSVNELTDADMGAAPNPAITIVTAIPKLTARAWAVVGRELYRSPEKNLLSKCDLDADPWNTNNWGAENQFFIADKTANIVRLTVTASGTLLVYKEDGIYTLGAAGEYVSLYTQLKMAASPDNGKAHAGFLNDEYVVYGGGTFRINSDFSMEAVGPEVMVRNTSPVKGPLTALAAHDTFNLYGLLYNPDSGDSYLMKYGAWARGEAQAAQRVEGWHGSISEAFAAKKGTALFKTAIGAPAGHHVMYLGFSDGTLGFFVLPCTPNPANCDEYAYSTASGYVYPAKATFLFEADQKALQGVTVENLSASPASYAQFEYRTERGPDWTALGVDFLNPIQYVDFPDGTSAVWLDWRLVLKSTVATATPQIAGVGIHHAVRPAVRLIYQFLVLAANNLLKRDGTVLRLSAEGIRQAIRVAANLAGPVTVVLPDESSNELLVTGYSEALAWDERNKTWRAAVQVEGAQFKINSSYGTYRRRKVYTYRELASYSFKQVKGL